MAIPDEKLYEYAVVRYVPHIEREEFINIGLIMMCKRRRWLCGAIRIDEPRIRAFDPDADIECIRRQAALFERSDVPSGDLPVEERYRWLAAVKSASLQVSPSHPAILPSSESTPETLSAEFNRLLRLLV